MAIPVQGMRNRAAFAPGVPLRTDLVRAFAYCWIAVAALYLAFNVVLHLRAGLSDGAGEPLGADFINSWSGAVLAWSGNAATVYDWKAYHAFQEKLVGASLDFYHYSYPPSALVLTAPFAAIPYLPGLALWLATGWLAFFAALRKACAKDAWLLALASPAVFVNALGGQNGMWSAALLGGGLGLLQRRPALAGVLFGLFVYKPQLALLIPVALVAGRQWAAIAWAAATSCGVVAISVSLFGIELWADYFRNVSLLREAILENGSGVWHRMLSVFVFGRRLGLDVTSAYVLQAAFAIAAAAVVAYAWHRDVPARARYALLVLGTCLVTPYLQDYDLVVGTFAAVWLMTQVGGSPRLQRWAFAASALVLLVPLGASPLAKLTGFAFGPVFLVPAFLLAMQIAFTTDVDGAVRPMRAASA